MCHATWGCYPCQGKKKNKKQKNMLFLEFWGKYLKRNPIYYCFRYAKHTKKNLDGNCPRMLRVILNKSWKNHPTKQQLYSHLLPISKTIQIRWTGHAGHCWRSQDELISDIIPWTPSYSRASVGRPTRTYLQQLNTDTGCCQEDLSEAIDDINE